MDSKDGAVNDCHGRNQIKEDNAAAKNTTANPIRAADRLRERTFGLS